MGSGWLVFTAVKTEMATACGRVLRFPQVPLPPSPVSQYLSLLLSSQPATIQGPGTEMLWNSSLVKLWD